APGRARMAGALAPSRSAPAAPSLRTRRLRPDRRLRAQQGADADRERRRQRREGDRRARRPGARPAAALGLHGRGGRRAPFRDHGGVRRAPDPRVHGGEAMTERTMKAAFYTEYGGPEVLRFGDVPRPVLGPR